MATYMAGLMAAEILPIFSNIMGFGRINRSGNRFNGSGSGARSYWIGSCVLQIALQFANMRNH